MVWNAAGTFHTRLSATALTANREFVFPDTDGTFVVASAGSAGVDRLSASSVFATVLTATTAHVNQLSSSLAVALLGNINLLSSSGIIALNADINHISASGVVALRADINQISASAIVATSIGANQMTASAISVINTVSASGMVALRADMNHISASSMDLISLILHRQNAVDEGGQIGFNRAADDGQEWFIDCIGAGSTDTTLRLLCVPGFGVIQTLAQSSGVTTFVGPLVALSTLTVSATAGIGGSLVLGGATVAAPYNIGGSIASTAGAACQFKNTLKSWCQFSAAAAGVTIRDSFNVSSVTRVSSGNYQVVFQNSMVNTNYGVVTTADNARYGYLSAVASGSYNIVLVDSAGLLGDGSFISTGTYNGAG